MSIRRVRYSLFRGKAQPGQPFPDLAENFSDAPIFRAHVMQAQPSLFASWRLRRPEAMTRAAGGTLLALSLATAVSVAAQAADEIKSGKWEFTTQMQLPRAVQAAPSGQAAGGNAPMTRIA